MNLEKQSTNLQMTLREVNKVGEGQKNVPKLRFKGYEDAWEQRKFSDIALRESTVQESSRDFPSVEYEDVIAEAGRLNKDVNQKEVAKKGIVFDGSQVLYGKLRPYLHNWLSPDFSGVAVGDWWVLKPIKVDKSFLYRLIQTQQFDDIANQSTGSKMPRADWNLVSNLEFAVPVSGDEQYKIGGYFSSLDTLIALHQRKYDALKSMKKTLLSKMFPKNGEDVPEIRFKGYTDAWEQRKLHECADFRRGSFPQPYGNKEWFDGKGAMPFVQVADVTDDMKLVQNTKQQISKLAQPMSVLAERGSVLVTLQGSIGRVAISQYNAFIDRTILVFDNYKIDIDKSFCAYVVKGKFADEKRKAPGGTIKTITKEVLSSFDLVIPSFNEQEDIGEFLVNLDQLITLHQRKLDELKNMKKTLLQQMFV